MAKVGYIFLADEYETTTADIEWMQNYGCVRVVQEKASDEKLRPEWRALLLNLERGDEIVVSRFSNAVRGTRELSCFLELCRIKVVRVISINDRIDSKDLLFPDTKPSHVLELIGSLPSEISAMKKSTSHIQHLKSRKSVSRIAKSREEREATIISLYNGGHAIDDIWKASGFRSRSSVFRILRNHGIALNRGPHSGPIKKRNSSEEKETNK